ncbi:MAG: flagellar motor protein MotB [Phycisphaerae bacterium]
MSDHDKKKKHDDSHDSGQGHGPGAGHGGGHEEGHEGAPEWLISFADNVALMMGFFVVLLAMNMAKPTTGGIGGAEKMGGAPESKDMTDLAISLREAFNNPVDPFSLDPEEQELVQRVRQRKGLPSFDGRATDPGKRGREQEVQSVRPSDYVGLGGMIVFEANAVAPDAAGDEQVREIAERLRGRMSIVEVRGHVSTAEAFGRDDRGMRLSYDRATEIARRLAEAGVGWDQMQLIASADNDRVNVVAYDLAAQRVNQRVEIIATDRPLSARLQSQPGDQDRAAPDEAPGGAEPNGHDGAPKAGSDGKHE